MSKLFLSGRPKIPANRELFWEDDFSPGWETRHDYKFRETDLTAVDAGTMNGYGAVSVTYPEGSDANVRWGGQIRFPVYPTGEETGWFEVDIKFHSPYSVPVNQKGPGIFASHTGWGFPASPPPPCDGGWLARYQLEPDASNHTQNRNAHLYHYDNDATRVNTVWDGISPRSNPGSIVLDTICRFQLYWQINTSAGSDDGIVQWRYDPGTATTHATPSTVRAENTTFSMYCGDETNRFAGFANEISISTFYGGPVSPSWEPEIDSTFTIGRLALYRPLT